jgi:hypothetical protein
MTHDQFESMAVLAMKLAGEIQWVDFPTLTVPALGQWQAFWTELLLDPQFIPALKLELREALNRLRERRQEADEEPDPMRPALAILFACLRRLLSRFHPSADQLAGTALRVKFSSMLEPMAQANVMLVDSGSRPINGARQRRFLA